MGTFGQLIIALVVTFIILGGPLTLYALVKFVNSWLGDLKVEIVKLSPKEYPDTPLGILLKWDSDSFPHEIVRIRCDAYEFIRGGRSASFSFTFEDKSAKKKSFLIPMKLKASDYSVVADGGIGDNPVKSVNRSYTQLEVENLAGETLRVRVRKPKIRKILTEPSYFADSEIETLPAKEPDSWSLLTRVFPWKKAAAVAGGEAPKAGAPKAAKAASSGPRLVDFVVTKVWIEPGCIVCDACENEAPDVFHVLADTCIVRENAPLGDGASIQAAAEGCPVDVIKYTTVPKTA